MRRRRAAAALLLAAAAAGLGACAPQRVITVDGLPIMNAGEHLDAVEELWRDFLIDQYTLPATHDDSGCFFLMYDDVALNSIVCGPVFWLGDEGPTWDYYPLETDMNSNGRTLVAVTRGRFAHDYPMSSADELHRPDRAVPNDGATLTEPDAPVVDGPFIDTGTLPEERRVTEESDFPQRIVLHTDPPTNEDETGRCVTLHRAIWSTHVGRGADVLAPPEGHQFLTLDARRGCDTGNLPMIDGAPEPDWQVAGTRFVLDGVEIPAEGWETTGSLVVPAAPEGGYSSALLISTLVGQQVSVDLLSGEPDPLTASLNSGVLDGEIADAAAAPVAFFEGWQLGESLTGRVFGTRPADRGAEVSLAGFLPQFGAPPEGYRWLVAGLTATFTLTDTLGGAPAGNGDAEFTAAVTPDDGLERPAIVVPSAEPEGSQPQRHITVVVAVPEDTTMAALTVTGVLSGWQQLSDPAVDLPEASKSLTTTVRLDAGR
ncbi:MAG TPA: hypothetical protein VFC82_09970 [Actinomycetaceae bacterium]|nr:hypothetical protein [Actinomycetaceae bacterium]